MDNVALVLVILGALNWGSIGLFGVDILGTILGGQLSMLSRIVFSIVGLAGLWSPQSAQSHRGPSGLPSGGGDG